MKTNAEYWDDFVSNNLPDSYKKWFEMEKKYLQKHVTKNARVLEIGCGLGRNIQDILPVTKNITGIDHDKKTITNIKNKFLKYSSLNFQEAEAEKLPFKNEVFDFVVCFTTFGNFGNKKSIILNEMKRVLKKSGSIIIDVFSEDALEERLKVYKKSRGKFKVEGTTVFFDDGLGDKISEQFNQEQLKNIFSKAKLRIENITKINIAYLCKLKKK